MSKQAFHVVPHDGAWAVRKKTGGSITVFDDKSAAIDEARKRARTEPNSEIIVHGKSGQIIQNTPQKSSFTDKRLRDAIRVIKDGTGFSKSKAGGLGFARAKKR